MREPRVVVTGLGLVTPMGIGREANAEGFRAGRTALKTITLFDTSRQRAHQGGEVSLAGADVNRPAAMLELAAKEALDQSGWVLPQDDTIPLVFGTSAGAMTLGEGFYKQTLNSTSRIGQARRIHGYYPQSQVLHLCKTFGIRGPITIIANACASGANAIGHAASLIRNGSATRMLCGGYDALAELVFAGFDSLQALSTTTPRPFDANRDGLALGEGAAVFTLEDLETAIARDATVLAEVAGYGASTDVHHLTQPHPDGVAALQSMRAACHDAKIEPGDIDYINSHGTGTPLNDSAEANAIRAWANGAVSKVRVSSTKGSIGHLLGGAGAVEAGICILAMRGGWIPPNVPVETTDPTVAFDLVTSPRDAKLTSVLTNSFGFGGANATVILTTFLSKSLMVGALH
jgi:3-oxoacyl-[acyl-carrier-protein] synthase II